MHTLTGGFGRSKTCISFCIAPVAPLLSKRTQSCSLAFTEFLMMSLSKNQNAINQLQEMYYINSSFKITNSPSSKRNEVQVSIYEEGL